MLDKLGRPIWDEPYPLQVRGEAGPDWITVDTQTVYVTFRHPPCDDEMPCGNRTPVDVAAFRL